MVAPDTGGRCSNYRRGYQFRAQSWLRGPRLGRFSPRTRAARRRMALTPLAVLAFLSSREWRNWQTRWLQVPVFERT